MTRRKSKSCPEALSKTGPRGVYFRFIVIRMNQNAYQITVKVIISNK